MCGHNDGGTGCESVPLSCSLCANPLTAEVLELVSDGNVEGRLCPRCSNNLRSILLDVNKTLIAIDNEAFFSDGIEAVTKALRHAFEEKLLDAGVSGRVIISFDVSADELMLKLHDGWYKWSDLRETLYKCED